MASRTDRTRLVASYAVLAVLAIAAIFPLVWICVSSLKAKAEAYRFPPTWWPHHFSLTFYDRVLHGTPFLDFLRSSLIVGLSSTALVVVLSAMAGYGLARGRFRGRRMLTRGVLAAYVFPTILYAVPLFTLMTKLGLTGSYGGIVLVHMAFNFPFCLWLMLQYFQTVPLEIEEAAKVDGLGNFGVFLRVALPLAAPGLATTAIFGFINSWNEFLLSFVILGGGDKRTLPVGIYDFVGTEVADYGPLMAAATLALIPTLILFMLVQRKISSGLTGGAVKG